MNIQIFGKNKCFDTKKAERYFKERRIKYQYVDLLRYGLSGKEFDVVLRGVGGIDRLINWDGKSDQTTMMRYTNRFHLYIANAKHGFPLKGEGLKLPQKVRWHHNYHKSR